MRKALVLLLSVFALTAIASNVAQSSASAEARLLRRPAMIDMARNTAATIDPGGLIIKGHGVDPDIVVDNDRARELAGEDQQLNKAIEVILDLLKKSPTKMPPPPPYPIKK